MQSESFSTLEVPLNPGGRGGGGRGQALQRPVPAPRGHGTALGSLSLTGGWVKSLFQAFRLLKSSIKHVLPVCRLGWERAVPKGWGGHPQSPPSTQGIGNPDLTSSARTRYTSSRQPRNGTRPPPLKTRRSSPTQGGNPKLVGTYGPFRRHRARGQLSRGSRGGTRCHQRSQSDAQRPNIQHPRPGRAGKTLPREQPGCLLWGLRCRPSPGAAGRGRSWCRVAQRESPRATCFEPEGPLEGPQPPHWD